MLLIGVESVLAGLVTVIAETDSLLTGGSEVVGISDISSVEFEVVSVELTILRVSLLGTMLLLAELVLKMV